MVYRVCPFDLSILKLGKNYILGACSEKNVSLKHLKWPKNPFKANLFFVQLKSRILILDFLVFKNPKWPPGGPKTADGVWKGVYPKVLGHSKQPSQNKFFDPSPPSMRKD